MKVLIIEDEAPAFRRLQKVLEELDANIEILEVIDSVEETVKWLRNHNDPDLIFMDIQLSDGISFEIFDQVKVIKPVIFTTAFDEYMLKAFRVNSIDYLLKPIKSEDVEASLQKFYNLREQFSNTGSIDLAEVVRSIHLNERQYKNRFLVKQGDKLISIKTEHIAYFQMRHGVVHLVTEGKKKFLLDQSLDEIQSQLDPTEFYRANRQFIIRYDAIETVHKYHKGKLLLEVIPQGEEQVIVSAEKAADFKTWLGS